MKTRSATQLLMIAATYIKGLPAPLYNELQRRGTAAPVKKAARKVKVWAAVGIVALLAAFSPSVHAVPILVVGNLVTVNNTSSNSAPFVALGSTPGSQTLNVTHGVLTATNAFYLSAQFTMDQTNYWTSPTVWYPSNTNACTEYVSATYWSFQPYMRLVCTSTNSIQYQATYGQ